MSREPEGYRLNLEQLNDAFPGVGMLSKRQVAEFVGADVRTVTKRFRFNATTGRISKADLARLICTG